MEARDDYRLYLPTWCQLDLDDGCTVNAIGLLWTRDIQNMNLTLALRSSAVDCGGERSAGNQRTIPVFTEQELIKLGMQDDGLNDLLVW